MGVVEEADVKRWAHGVVFEGSRLLDKATPDWWECVDLKVFEIQNQKTCILGQVYGGYHVGLSQVGVRVTESAAEYGFAIDGFDRFYDRMYHVEDAWREAIWTRAMYACVDAER